LDFGVWQVIMAFSESFWPEDLFDVICTDCFLPEIWVTQYPDVANEAGKRAALGQFVVVGFMAGELAVAASQLSDGDILLQALSQLDSMFGTINGSTTLNAEPCSKPSCTFQDTTDTMNSDSQVLEPDGEMMDPFPGVAEMPRKLITRSELHHWETASWDWKLKPASTSFQGGYVMNWELQEYVRGGYTHPSLHAHGARSTLAEPLSGRVFFAGEATHPGVNPCLQAAFDTGQRAASEIIALANLSRL
jgi:monoamine oxidase